MAQKEHAKAEKDLIFTVVWKRKTKCMKSHDLEPKMAVWRD